VGKLLNRSRQDL